MNEFIYLFTIIMIAASLLDGVSEGLLLKTNPVNYKGTGEDRVRKVTDGLEFLLTLVGMLIVFMNWGSFDLTLAGVIALTFYGLSIRWLLRDGLQNLGTGKGFFYTGTVSFIDKVLGGAPTGLKASIKIGFVLLGFLASAICLM